MKFESIKPAVQVEYVLQRGEQVDDDGIAHDYYRVVMATPAGETQIWSGPTVEDAVAMAVGQGAQAARDALLA